MAHRTLCILALFVLSLPSFGQDRAHQLDIAFARAAHLQHGVNASQWFAQSPGDYSAARTSRYTDDGDIALIAKLGFDNVRLSIDPVPLEKGPLGSERMNAEFLVRLDAAVDAMLAHGLAVQIDLHPEDSYKQQVGNSNAAVDRFVMLWRRLAAHYASRNPDLVFFEIMNEPEVHDPYRWVGIQARAASAIREAAPHNTIIATGPNYSDIVDLLAMPSLADGNVIYNFHFYDPHTFTHQGAGWGLSWWSETHAIPYPASEASMAAILPQVPEAADRFELENYWLDHWDAHRIRLLIDEAAAWGAGHHVPLICNEFGAFREHVDPQSRMNWLRDVRTALEADRIGWAMWDYRGGFGIVFKQDGKPAKVDPAVVDALGLKGQ